MNDAQDNARPEVAEGLYCEKEALYREWEVCEAGISRYDHFLFRIRTWAVTAFGLLILYAIRESETKALELSLVLTTLFWLCEGNAKYYQFVFIERCRAIETFLQSRIYGEQELNSPHRFPHTSLLFSERKISKLSDWLTKSWGHILGSVEQMLTGHTLLIYISMFAGALYAGW